MPDQGGRPLRSTVVCQTPASHPKPRCPMFDRKRREFITLLGGAAAWPLAATAQQDGRIRRVGVLVRLAENDPEAKARFSAFRQRFENLRWPQGPNLHLPSRYP